MFLNPMQEALRQIGRWMLASAQDKHPYVALLHANYAVGNIDLLRSMFTDDQVLRQTGEHIHQLRKRAIMLQDKARKRFSRSFRVW